MPKKTEFLFILTTAKMAVKTFALALMYAAQWNSEEKIVDDDR